MNDNATKTMGDRGRALSDAALPLMPPQARPLAKRYNS